MSAPRSGATLLAAMLNQHPKIAMFNEPWFFLLEKKYGSLRYRGNVRSLLEDLSISAQEFGCPLDEHWITAINDDILASDIEQPLEGFLFFLDRFSSLLQKPRWGIKQPLGFSHLLTLAKVRPDIKFIHIMRDPRSTVAFRMARSQSKMVKENLVETLRFARSWSELSRQAVKLHEMVGHNYLKVRYEELVVSPQMTLDRIMAFLGETFQPSMLSYYSSDQAYIPLQNNGRPKPTHLGLLEPVHQNDLDRWKELLTNREIILVESVCREMSREGYEPSNPKNNFSKRDLTNCTIRLRISQAKKQVFKMFVLRPFHLGRRFKTRILEKKVQPREYS